MITRNLLTRYGAQPLDSPIFYPIKIEAVHYAQEAQSLIAGMGEA